MGQRNRPDGIAGARHAGNRVSEGEVGFALGHAFERFRSARIRGFVTLLADRDAHRRLRAFQRERVTSIELEALGRVVMSEGGRYGQHDR